MSNPVVVRVARKLAGTLFQAIFRDEFAFSTRSYSQEGEDMILRKVFDSKRAGFFVDVGAHHPRRFSNTYFFYRIGWSGLNLDAMPGSMAEFARLRPRDINLEIAISRTSGDLKTFYIFEEPAINTFDEALAKSRSSGPGARKIVGTAALRTQTLREVLAAHLPPRMAIDFLTIDVEGFDLEVLQSNDWDEYRPVIVLTECFGASPAAFSDHPVHTFLRQRDYEFFACSVNTMFFRDARAAAAQRS